MSTNSLAGGLPTKGRAGHLTAEEQAALDKLKSFLAEQNIKNEKYDDNLLLRFLRARKFDFEATKKMFLDFHEWRKSFGADALRDQFDFPEFLVVAKAYPRFYHKTDKLGRPVYFEQIGSLDVKQLWSVTTVERMLKNHVYSYEKLIDYRLPACSAKKGEHIEQSCSILDLKGVSLSSFSSVYSTVKEISAIAQNYYPEMLGKMFIINAPFLFTATWSLVKPLLDEVTVSKINILGSSYKARLLEFIDEENLPVMFGGKCSCEGGCADSDVGPWNDGTVEGYPKPEFERLNIEYGYGVGGKKLAHLAKK